MDQEISVYLKGAIHKLQLYLLNGIKSEDQLFAIGSLISQSDYSDVVTERSIANLCGYPLCKNALPLEPSHKGRYRISLKEHKLYDLQETLKYCSDSCVVNSRAFSSSLFEERCTVTNPSKIRNILNLFEDSDGDSETVLYNDEDRGLSRLTIHEKPRDIVREVSVEDWVGPSTAIEGYVPHKDLAQMELDCKSMIITCDDKSPTESNPLKSTKKLKESSPRSNGESSSSNQASEKIPKSSLKAPNAKKTDRSVSWVDQKANNSGESQATTVSLEHIAKSEGFNPENSWYDFPPEGFNLTLSPFSIMWDTLFRWITSSSLAFIYGRGEDNLMLINGRVYPMKCSLNDGRSLEIRQTISGFLSRAFPELISLLKLSLPVSSIEKCVDQFLNTMSFVDGLPGLRMKQWNVIALLFLEALSVCQLPALSLKHNPTSLLNNILNGTKIQLDEYEILRNLVLPLGTLPALEI